MAPTEEQPEIKSAEVVTSAQILKERVPAEALGGPVDAAKLFELVYQKALAKGALIEQARDGVEHPVLAAMKKNNSLKETSQGGTRDFANESCDAAFAHYLLDFAQIVKLTYYKGIAMHLLLFHDCLNTLGQQRKEMLDADPEEEEKKGENGKVAKVA